MLRHAFAAARIWLDHSLHMRCAWPGADSGPPVSAPSPRALAALLPATLPVGRR